MQQSLYNQPIRKKYGIDKKKSFARIGYMEIIIRLVNFKSLREDLRKLGVTFIIGGLTGLFLRPHNEIIPLVVLSLMGLIIWYLGLCDGENNND